MVSRPLGLVDIWYDPGILLGFAGMDQARDPSDATCLRDVWKCKGVLVA